MFIFYYCVCVSSEEQTQVIRLGGEHLYLMSHPTVPGRCIGLVNIRAGVFPIGNMQAQSRSCMPLQFQTAAGDLESP